MCNIIPYLAAFLISSAIGIAVVFALETLQRNPREFCGTAFDGNASFSIVVVCHVPNSRTYIFLHKSMEYKYIY